MAYISSSPTVSGCTFADNGAFNSGGGMYNNECGGLTVTDCRFERNAAVHNYGGGMLNWESDTTVANCTFSGSTASIDGGGIFNFLSDLTVTNCTFSGNTSKYGGGMYTTRAPWLSRTARSAKTPRNTAAECGPPGAARR